MCLEVRLWKRRFAELAGACLLLRASGRPRDGWGWGARRQRCLNPDHNSAYRIALTVGAAVDKDWVAPGGDESSILGGTEQLLGWRCLRRSGCLGFDLWRTQAPCGAGFHLWGEG